MPRIEILFDKESSNKPSEKYAMPFVRESFKKSETNMVLLNVRVALSSSTSLIVSGTKNDDDAKEIKPNH